EIDSALPDQRRFQQVHRAQDGHRRGYREGSCQGDPAQDQGPKPNPGCDLGSQQQVAGTKQRLLSARVRKELATKVSTRNLRDRTNRDAGPARLDPGGHLSGASDLTACSTSASEAHIVPAVDSQPPWHTDDPIRG